MKRAESATTATSARRSERLKRMAAIAGGSEAPFGFDVRDWTTLGVVAYMGLLLIQFGLGMGVNLFVAIPDHHPGAGASNVFVGFAESLTWAITHGPVPLAIHAVLCVVVQVHPIFVARALPRLVPKTRWPTAVAPICVLVAGLSGPAFLAYHLDLFSLLMALGFGGAMLCYAITLYLVSRSAGEAPAVRHTAAPAREETRRASYAVANGDGS